MEGGSVVTTTMKGFLDQAADWLSSSFYAMSRWHNVNWALSYDEEDWDDEDDRRKPAQDLASAEVLGSKYDPDDDLHVLMLDVDLELAVLPSTTPGHYHLVFDQGVPWEDYKDFLDACVKVGIVGEGYRNMAVKRGEAMLRPPWIRKGHEVEDAAAAMVAHLLGEETDGDTVRDIAAQRDFAEAWDGDPF